MVNQAAARELAARDVPAGLEIDAEHARELREGWFFPYRASDPHRMPLGTKGIIVNKKTGATFGLGSAFPIERDLALYDRGYQFNRYDLVVTRIVDLERTLDTLQELEISVVEPKYEYGTVWRIPRRLMRTELRLALATLPHVFGSLPLYFRAEALEKARREGLFQYELLGCG
jgi:hypothetical protein